MVYCVYTEISSDPYVFDITVVVEAADDDKSGMLVSVCLQRLTS